MARGDILTYFHNRKWHNVVEGDTGPFSDHFTKGDAWETGLQEALRCKVDHTIRSSTGQILERTSYRYDEADDPVLRVPDIAPAPAPVPTALHIPAGADTPPGPDASAAQPRPRVGRHEPAPTQSRLDPRVRQVLREVDAEMRGRPAGEILWTLMSRMPSAARKNGQSMQQLAAHAAAIHAGTFRV